MWQLSFPLPERVARELSATGGSGMLEEAIRRCGQWHEPLPTLLRKTKAADVTGYPAYDRPVPCFSSKSGIPHLTVDLEKVSSKVVDDKVVLVGDACHPMSPFKGQGANQAVLDAWELAVALASIPNDENPLDQFKVQMARRVKAKVQLSAAAATLLHSPSALTEGNCSRASVARGCGDVETQS